MIATLTTTSQISGEKDKFFSLHFVAALPLLARIPRASPTAFARRAKPNAESTEPNEHPAGGTLIDKPQPIC